MRLGQAIISGFRNFAVLSGRAGFDEYWHFARFVRVANFVVVACIVYYVVRSTSDWMGSMAGLSSGVTASATQPALSLGATFVFAVPLLALTVPLWSCAVRRLHDTGRPGWHYVVPPLLALSVLGLAYAFLVPAGVSPVQAFTVLFTPIWIYEPRLILGLIAFAILAILLRNSLLRKLSEPSQPGPNRYGPPPSEVTQ